jgi:hypothetical protein
VIVIGEPYSMCPEPPPVPAEGVGEDSAGGGVDDPGDAAPEADAEVLVSGVEGAPPSEALQAAIPSARSPENVRTTTDLADHGPRFRELTRVSIYPRWNARLVHIVSNR